MDRWIYLDKEENKQELADLLAECSFEDSSNGVRRANSLGGDKPFTLSAADLLAQVNQ